MVLAIVASASYPAQAQTHTRTDQIVYHDNLSSWVLGQQVSSTNINTGVVEFKTDYHPVTALPERKYGPGTSATPGKLVQTATYYADGTLATVKDGNNNVTTLTDWYRGIPRTLQYADGAVESATVSPQGWITSVTDGNGFTTGYGYDAMGRLASIVYPTGDTTAWNTETFTFTPIQQDEHGLAPGHWTMRRRLGNRHVNTYYDGLWRPVLEESLDYADIGGTLTQVVKRYDANGRIIFQSYPKRGVDRLTESQGLHTVYDALGRVTGVSQDSEHGLLTTLTEYLPGFQTRVTNPRGQQTLTIYQAFDQPTYDFPAGISELGGDRHTEIYRDVFGKVTALRRRNGDASTQVWRHYVYDAHQQLCKAVEPETGATIMDYDEAGNLQWSASGLHHLMGTTGCDTIAGRDSGRKVMRTYDGRNRLHQLLFPNGVGDQLWSYTPDGLPSQVTTWNETGGNAAIVNNYVYNRRRLLVGESVHLPNWYVWGLGYAYDANGSLAAHTYPTGLAITYAPNALGQATQARDQSGAYYASAASYYPNGALKQFTYGNGIVHSMSQNARQLPQDVQSSGGVLHDRYAYDGNGNVTSILDVQDGGHLGWALRNRYLGYDGLDRLTDAGSGSFGGDHWHRFTYNALDNITSWKLAGVKDHTYVYDAQNRLGNLKNPDGSTVVGFGYDVQGNLANKNGRPYTFDFGNRLREAYGPTGATGGPEWYRYDAYGRRVHAWGPALSLIASQYSQSGQILYTEDYRAGKNLEHIYLAGSVIAIREWSHAAQSHSAKFHHTDALGSPVAVTNQAGAVIERNDYEPYGAIIGKPTYQGIGYTGHVQDGATGLTYMQQRYYDPQVGLFLSVDPVSVYASGDGRQFNAYSYAFNNPYKFNDPDGRQSAIARDLIRVIPAVSPSKNEQEQGVVDPAPSGTDSDGNGRPDNARPARPTGRDSVRRGRDGQPIATASSAPPPSGGDGGDDEGDTKLTHNPKHHQNSQSPEPKNVRELYRRSIADRSGVRWARDENGTIHRFSRPSNGETHWNGSTAGDKPIQMRNIPNEVIKQLK